MNDVAMIANGLQEGYAKSADTNLSTKNTAELYL